MLSIIFGVAKLGFDFVAGRAIAVFNMRMQIATFIIDRWRVILPVAVLCLSLLYVHALRNQVSVAKSESIVAKKALIDYANANAELAAKRDAENKLNAILAKKKTDAEIAKHKNALTQIITKGRANEKLSDSRINSYRDRLSIETASQAARLFENDADRLTETNSHPALPRPISEVESELIVCQEAGAIAAADYVFVIARSETKLAVKNLTGEFRRTSK